MAYITLHMYIYPMHAFIHSYTRTHTHAHTFVFVCTYSYFSIAVSFFKAILYKLYNPIVTFFKYQFLQRAGVMKRLLLKLFSLIAIKRLTSALKQTVIARHSFPTV